MFPPEKQGLTLSGPCPIHTLMDYSARISIVANFHLSPPSPFPLDCIFTSHSPFLPHLLFCSLAPPSVPPPVFCVDLRMFSGAGLNWHEMRSANIDSFTTKYFPLSSQSQLCLLKTAYTYFVHFADSHGASVRNGWLHVFAALKHRISAHSLLIISTLQVYM